VQYRGGTVPVQQIGRELGVDYVLTGTVRWEKLKDGASRVQVSPELIEVTMARAKWQQSFNAALTDVFQVQAQIAGNVAEALNLALAEPAKHTLEEKPTANLAAYDAFLKGEAVSQSVGIADAPRLREAIGYYEQAVALDATFLHAWSQLARALSILYYNGTPTAAGADQARHAAERAVALAPGRPETHLALGDYHYFVRADFARARTAYQEGLRVAPADAALLSGSTITSQSTGDWDGALATLRRAQTLDPRSIFVARRLALTLLRLRRYPEALAAADRALVLAPTNLQVIENKAMVYLAQGDLAGARAVFRNVSLDVEPTTLAAYVANYWDLFWVLDDDQQQLVLRLAPSAFDDDRATWGLVLAQTWHLRGNAARARAYADSAHVAFEGQLRSTPNDAQLHALHGLSLALMGRSAEAIAQGERAVAMVPLSADGYTAPYLQHQLARIYILIGEPDKALDRLEPLLKTPYYLSPEWLKIDPTFDPIRQHPRFQKLVEAGATS
jgi:serine/threonine-protein kinase